MFTKADLAEMICSQVTVEVYCADCKVIVVNDGDKYCLSCCQVIADYLFNAEIDKLAEQVKEKIAIDKGLY